MNNNQKSNQRIFFVMPAYNEAENIHEVVEQWYPVVEQCGSECRLVIANDGSKDNTFEMMEELAKTRPQFIPLNKKNSGHGATVLYLYRYALEHGANYIFQTDSDGQTNPQEFFTFLKDIDKYDFQIGTRYTREDGLSRIFVTKTLKLIVWMMFGEVVKDANTPFRLMKADRLREVMKIVPDDFFLSNVAISAIVVKWRERLGWHPITFRPRQGGVNSINMKRIIGIGWKALGDFKIIKKNLREYEKQHKA